MNVINIHYNYLNHRQQNDSKMLSLHLHKLDFNLRLYPRRFSTQPAYKNRANTRVIKL